MPEPEVESSEHPVLEVVAEVVQEEAVDGFLELLFDLLFGWFDDD